jgi:hypothetical protein
VSRGVNETIPPVVYSCESTAAVRKTSQAERQTSLEERATTPYPTQSLKRIPVPLHSKSGRLFRWLVETYGLQSQLIFRERCKHQAQRRHSSKTARLLRQFRFPF